MLEKVGFVKWRLILHLTFPPYPIIIPPLNEPHTVKVPTNHDVIQELYEKRDFYLENIADTVDEFNFQQFTLSEDDPTVGLGVFDQSLVYQQVSADDPWPTEEEVLKRARVWRIFNQVGIEQGDKLKEIFDHIRDIAVSSNVAKITWLIDRSDPLPQFVFEAASVQKDYWMLFRSIKEGWQPQWKNTPIYVDTRDL